MNRRSAWALSAIAALVIAVAVLVVGARAGQFGFGGVQSAPISGAQRSSGLADSGASLVSVGDEEDDDAADEEHEHEEEDG